MKKSTKNFLIEMGVVVGIGVVAVAITVGIIAATGGAALPFVIGGLALASGVVFTAELFASGKKSKIKNKTEINSEQKGDNEKKFNNKQKMKSSLKQQPKANALTELSQGFQKNLFFAKLFKEAMDKNPKEREAMFNQRLAELRAQGNISPKDEDKLIKEYIKAEKEFAEKEHLPKKIRKAINKEQILPPPTFTPEQTTIVNSTKLLEENTALPSVQNTYQPSKSVSQHNGTGDKLSLIEANTLNPGLTLREDLYNIYRYSSSVSMVDNFVNSCTQNKKTNFSNLLELSEFMYVGAKQEILRSSNPNDEHLQQNFQTTQQIFTLLKQAQAMHQAGTQMSVREIWSRFSEIEKNNLGANVPKLKDIITQVVQKEFKHKDQYYGELGEVGLEQKKGLARLHHTKKDYSAQIEDNGTKVRAVIHYDNKDLIGKWSKNKQKEGDSKAPKSSKNSREAYEQMRKNVHEFLDFAIYEAKKGTPNNPINIHLSDPKAYELAVQTIMNLKLRAIETGQSFTIVVPEALKQQIPQENFQITPGEVTDQERHYFNHFAKEHSCVYKKGKEKTAIYTAGENVFKNVLSKEDRVNNNPTKIFEQVIAQRRGEIEAKFKGRMLKAMDHYKPAQAEESKLKV